MCSEVILFVKILFLVKVIGISAESFMEFLVFQTCLEQVRFGSCLKLFTRHIPLLGNLRVQSGCLH